MGKQLEVLKNEGKRVLTTGQLAEVYGTDVVRIRQGFNRNKDRFIEGKHYFKLEGEKLKKFKTEYLKDTSSMLRVNCLYLWTERGADRHCKILDTDKAWEQFDNLENTYFNIREIGLTEEQKLQLSIFNAKDKNEAIVNSSELDRYRKKQLEEKDGLLLEQGQKTSLYDDFIGSDDIYSIDNVSKTFAIKGMGRNKLYKYLRDNYIIMNDIYEDYNGKTRNGLKHYTAFARYTNTQQYFKHRQRKYYIGNRIVRQNVAMFTAKGVSWIYKRLQKDGYIVKKDLDTIIEELKENRQVA